MKAAIITAPEGSQLDPGLKLTLQAQFELVDPNKAEVLLVVGGDGTMVWVTKEYQGLEIPFYGINRGTIGFLLNNHGDSNHFASEVESAISTEFPLLQANIYHTDGNVVSALAFNDVWTKATNLRGQGAKHRIFINDKDIMEGTRFGFFSGDGIIVCTPGGSTAYSRSAGGIILDPHDSSSIQLPPICPYIPYDFRPQVLPGSSEIKLEMLEQDKRQHIVVADNQVFTDIAAVVIVKSKKTVSLLFRQKLSYFSKTAALRFPWNQQA